jgi:tRNA guanosine-2'-O-methyltransferase
MKFLNNFQVTIGNKAVLQDSQFQRISVSSEKWVPILEVNAKNVPLYLTEKKNDGYTILGVEQVRVFELLCHGSEISFS